MNVAQDLPLILDNAAQRDIYYPGGQCSLYLSTARTFFLPADMGELISPNEVHPSAVREQGRGFLVSQVLVSQV